MKKAGYLSLTIFGSVFIIVCLFGYFRGSSTENWPEISGETLSITLEEKYNFFRGKRSSRGSSKKYEVHITYKYKIGEQEYISKAYEMNFVGLKTNLKGSRSYLEDVLKVHQKYKPGKSVEVYYDPDNPSNALLVKGYQGYISTYLIFSLLAIGYGVYGLFKD